MMKTDNYWKIFDHFKVSFWNRRRKFKNSKKIVMIKMRSLKVWKNNADNIMKSIQELFKISRLFLNNLMISNNLPYNQRSIKLNHWLSNQSLSRDSQVFRLLASSQMGIVLWAMRTSLVREAKKTICPWGTKVFQAIRVQKTGSQTWTIKLNRNSQKEKRLEFKPWLIISLQKWIKNSSSSLSLNSQINHSWIISMLKTINQSKLLLLPQLSRPMHLLRDAKNLRITAENWLGLIRF